MIGNKWEQIILLYPSSSLTSALCISNSCFTNNDFPPQKNSYTSKQCSQ